jgi:hypothetical protein
LKLSVRSLDA